MGAHGTTVFINETKQAININVGNHQFSCHLATLESGAKYTMQVDFNATYQEFFIDVKTEGKKLVVSSDDCCDHKCIAIKEVEGKCDVLKEPRMAPTTTANVEKSKFSWKLWR